MICHFCWLLVAYHGQLTAATPLTVVRVTDSQVACQQFADRNQKRETRGRTWECLAELHREGERHEANR